MFNLPLAQLTKGRRSTCFLSRIIITVEEHNVVGGLADAVSEVVTDACPVKITRIGVQDRFGFSGPAWELLDDFGLTQPHIARVIREVVGK